VQVVRAYGPGPRAALVFDFLTTVTGVAQPSGKPAENEGPGPYRQAPPPRQPPTLQIDIYVDVDTVDRYIEVVTAEMIRQAEATIAMRVFGPWVKSPSESALGVAGSAGEQRELPGDLEAASSGQGRDGVGATSPQRLPWVDRVPARWGALTEVFSATFT